MDDKKKAKELDLIIEMLTEESQKIVNEFLSLYKESSQVQYKSAICNLLFKLEKNDIKELNYEDYLKSLEVFNKNNKENTQNKYRTRFFQFLYAHGKINPQGFENIWLKKFSKSPREKVIDLYKPVISFEQFEKIFEYMDMECIENNERMKTSFALYMLFYTDCPITALKEVAYDNFNNGILKIENNPYNLPEKYWPIFTKLLKESNHNGFHSLHKIIDKFGILMDIQKLTPQKLREAKGQISIKCSSCGQLYLYYKKYWESVNNKILCVKCAEELKKKFKYDIKTIDNISINFERLEDDVSISSIIYTYDELKNKLSKRIDYLKLHEFQIEIGKLGEAFVYDYEKERLKDTEYFDLIDNTKALDNRNGYDILSYDKTGKELHIEVKTEPGIKENCFYITQNEREVGMRLIRQGKKYLIYRVHNILAKDKGEVSLEIIDDIFNESKYKFEEQSWKVSKKL